MESLHSFKARLALLDAMLGKLKTSHARVKQLRRSVHVLRHLLQSDAGIPSPYGPETPIVRFSVQ